MIEIIFPCDQRVVKRRLTSSRMFVKTMLVLSVTLNLGSCTQADTAFGFTNFKIKLKSKHGVIDRSVARPRQNIIEAADPELKLGGGGGPAIFDEGRGVRIPMVFILNERIENPKFVSRQPKRKKIKNISTEKIKHISTKNEIGDRNRVIKKNTRKHKTQRRPKFSRFKSETDNHANILNTNFRFAYLRKMKLKRLAEINQNKAVRRVRKVKRVRKKL